MPQQRRRPDRRRLRQLVGATDWSNSAAGWCTSPYQRLKLGDINGDGLDDLLCHDRVSCQRWVDYSNAGQFGGTN